MILGRFDTPSQLSANASGLASTPVDPPLPSDLALLEGEAGAFPVPSALLRGVSLLPLAAVALATLFIGVRHLAKGLRGPARDTMLADSVDEKNRGKAFGSGTVLLTASGRARTGAEQAALAARGTQA
jgi:hypothetical protein